MGVSLPKRISAPPLTLALTQTTQSRRSGTHLLHGSSVRRSLTRVRRPLGGRSRRRLGGCLLTGRLAPAAPAARTPSAAARLGVESNLHRATRPPRLVLSPPTSSYCQPAPHTHTQTHTETPRQSRDARERVAWTDDWGASACTSYSSLIDRASLLFTTPASKQECKCKPP